MRSLAGCCLIALGLSAAAIGNALAQSTVNVVAGHEVRISHWVSLNPDCTPIGQILLRVTQAPQHGRVSIRDARIFPNFPNSNVRNVCNTRRVRGVEAYYRPEPGYFGFDAVGLEMISPGGSYRQATINIQVR